MTPAQVADILRRASMGDGHDFLLAADDIREKDLHYRAVLQTRTLAVAGLPMEIAPRDESSPAQRAAALVREALDAIDAPALIAQLMDAVAKGYAVAEIVWETVGGHWRPREIIPREAHWFSWDRDSGRILRLMDGSVEGQAVPPYRFIVHRPPMASGIPLLGGVARSACGPGYSSLMPCATGHAFVNCSVSRSGWASTTRGPAGRRSGAQAGGLQPGV